MLYDAPIELITPTTVKPEWIDYNGHMNVAFYVLAFDEAIDKIYEELGLGPVYRNHTNQSTFALEGHIQWIREIKLGDFMQFTAQLLDCDTKRLHFFLTMKHAEKKYLAATYENLSMHVDLATRRASAFPNEIQGRINTLMQSHKPLAKPKQVGSIVGIRR